ncbi:MAG: ribonuclease HI [Nitrospira bacterium HGW-Nitrospira-1]|nr:MAG: ribonuclease HI [Nitrospira bacterium HGW-Nitrospira-1]
MKKHGEKPFVEIYADGACSGNPGLGGYGAILRAGEKCRELSGCEKLTTNNRMEMMAVITALEALKRPCSVKITTDSTYIVKGMTEWIKGWIKNNWKNSQRKDVLNRDLWEKLLKAADGHEIAWEWIKGHNGHYENERCDLLAREAIKKFRKGAKDEKA